MFWSQPLGLGEFMRLFRNYLRSDNGNVAMIFALLILSIIVLMGGGLDFSKHRSQSVTVQSALDATAIHMVQEQNVPPGQITQRARDYFDANATGLTATITGFNATRNGDVFNISVNADVETNFLGLVGLEILPISRRAESTLSVETREIALVLDTTGSMSGDRLANLKTATNLLLDRLENSSANEDGNLQVGIVPFDEFVRVNPVDFDPNWLDADGRSAAASNIFGEEINLLDLFNHLGEDWAGCLRARPGNLAFRDTPVNLGDFDTRFTPLFSYDEGDDGSYANNYITDAIAHPDGISSVTSFLKYGIAPGTGNDASLWTTVPTSIGGSLGPNRHCASEPIVPLTDDIDAVRDVVDALSAQGDTHLTEAIVWGQRLLSDHAPFTGSLPINTFGNRKILIFLSDGINSVDGGNSDLRSPLNVQGYAGFGELATILPPNPVEDDINDYLDDEFLPACDAIKAAGTQIIVIRLEQTDSESLALLSNCATSTADFFNVPDANQLDAVFGEIALRVTAVRLSE